MKLLREIMIALLMVFAPSLSGIAVAQTTVTFLDSNLERAVRSGLGRLSDPLTDFDLESLTSLTARSLNITNLSGLEFATNLTCLYLSENAIGNVTPLQALTRLVKLEADHNRLSNISPLASLTSLTTLSLGENFISDGGVLSGLTNLSELRLSANSITNLTFLQSLTQLGSLELDKNLVASLSPLVTLTNLHSLSLDGNPGTDYAALSALTNLTSLSVREGLITNLTVLMNLSRLASLNLYRTPIRDLTPLVGLTNLSALDLRYCPLTNYDLALVGLTNLTSLYLGGICISNVVFLRDLVRLTFLNLADNNIRDLSPLDTLTNLNYLVLSKNPITNYMLLSSMTNLVNLELRDSSLSNLNFVSSLTRLSYADLAYDNIVDISPLVTLTNLSSLILTGNPIGDHTGLSGLTNLANLWLTDNSISNLTFLQSLSQLSFLILDDNHIADPAPLASLENLTGLGLSRNSITNPEALAGFTNLTSLWLDGNSISNLSFLPRLTRLKMLELQNNQIGDFENLDGLTNLVTVFADNNRLTNITTLDQLPYLSRVQLVGNPLEVRSGSTVTTIQSLLARGVDLAYLPTNQPPAIWVSTNWFIAVNESSSLGFFLSDDVTSPDQLLVTIKSSNPGLISDASIVLTSTNFDRALTVTPAPNLTGTTTLTLTVQDAAGTSKVVGMRVTVLVPQPVSVTDPYLAAAIRSTLNKPTGSLSSVDLLALTDLFVSDTNLTDLSGLEWATNLTSLYLRGNAVTNLAVLQSLGQLTSFALYNNTTADLSQLTTLTNLLGLYLVGNSISNLTFLQNLTRLTFLNLDHNQIADLAPITAATNLNSVSLRQNRLSNLVPFQDLSRLTDINISLNLLNVDSNSQATALIQAWEQRGVIVNYLPQRGPPDIMVRPAWLITQNTAASLSFGVSDNGVFTSQFGVTADSGSSVIIPNESVSVGKAAFEDWYLSVIPATNQIGTTLVTLTATNDAGLSSSTTILVSVVVPLPLDDQLLEGTNFTWLTGGNALWFGQADVSHGGGSAVQSGSIVNDQESWMEMTLAGPGVLTFWWKVSSEKFYDWLEFSLNGVLDSERLSGEEDWQQRSVNIPRGTQVARWRYSKDDGYSTGLDTAWVDQVNFLPLSWLELMNRPTNGQCQLLLHPVLGKMYQLQSSTNLTAWFPLAVVTATNTAMPFLDPTANAFARFYRLQEFSVSSIQLRNPRWIANEFQLEVHSLPGLRFELQASEDLVSWSGLSVVTNTLGSVQYADVQATNSPKRYYRALLLP